MAGLNQAQANGAIDPHYSLEQFTHPNVINPLPVEQFLEWLDGSIFWRYLVLLKIYVITIGIYIRYNIPFLFLTSFPWTLIFRFEIQRLFFAPTGAFFLVLVDVSSIVRQHGNANDPYS